MQFAALQTHIKLMAISLLQLKMLQCGSTRSWSLNTKERGMPLINVIFTLIVVGVVLGLVNRYLPMDGRIKSILNAVIVVAVVLWLLNGFGFLAMGSGMRFGG
jgi:hypothetical protein